MCCEKLSPCIMGEKRCTPPVCDATVQGGGGHKTQQRFARVENFSRFYTGRCAGRASSWKCNKSKVQRCVLSSKMRARAKRVKHTKKTSKRNPQKEKREGVRGREGEEAETKRQQKSFMKIKRKRRPFGWKMILNNDVKMRDSQAETLLLLLLPFP